MFFSGARSFELLHGWTAVSLLSLGRGDPVLQCCGSTLALPRYLFCLISFARALEVGCAVAAVLPTWSLLIVATWGFEFIEQNTLSKSFRDKTFFFFFKS